MPQNYKNQPSINRFNFLRWYQDKNLLGNAEFAIGSGNNFTNWTKTVPTRTNKILYSQDISNAAWGNINSPTITSNIAIAPNGTTTADGLQSTSSGSYRAISQTNSCTSNSTHTGSVYIKKESSETGYGGLEITYTGGSSKTTYVIFNAVLGTAYVYPSSLTPIVNVRSEGNFWRLIVTATDTGSNTNVSFTYYATLSNNGTTLGNNSGSIRTLWGFQLENTPYATPYNPTTSTAVTADDGQIVAATRANMFPYSEATTSWVTTSATDNGTILGYNGVKIITNPAVYGDNPFKAVPNFTFNKYYTASYYVDFNSVDPISTTIELAILGFTPSISVIQMVVNKDTKVITNTTTGTGFTFLNAECIHIEDNIYRISLSVYCNVTQLGGVQIYTPVGNASGGYMTLTACQVEESQFATEYIKTLGSTVTVNDGINTTRAVRLDRSVTSGLAINQASVLGAAGDYKLSFWAKKATIAEPAIKVLSETSTFDTIAIDTTYFKKYEIVLPALSPDNQIALYNDVENTSVVIDNARLELVQEGVTIGAPQPYLMDPGRMSFPILAPTDILQFYINNDTPITGLTKSDLVPVLYNDQGIRQYAWSTSVLSEISYGVGKQYYSSTLNLSSVLTGLPEGLYYLAIYNTSTGNVLYTSNYLYLRQSGYEDISSQVKFRHYKSIFRVDYTSLGSFYQQFRIMLLEKEIAYGGEKNQYREITTGTVRTTSSYDERVVKAETYYFDREMHEAMDNMCRHDDITINSKSYIAKGSYEPNIDQLSKVSKGEVELIDQEFTQINS